jgi:hypothetical protein
MNDYDDDRGMFQDPGGKSALRRASRQNPRNLPCPTCNKPNRLTPADKRQGLDALDNRKYKKALAVRIVAPQGGRK